MKFDKESFIYIIAIIVTMMYFMRAPENVELQKGSEVEKAGNNAETKTEIVKSAPVKKVEQKKLEVFNEKIAPVVLNNELTEVEIDVTTGSVDYIALKKHKLKKGVDDPIKLFNTNNCSALSVDGKGWQLVKKPVVKSTSDSLELTRQMLVNKQTFEIKQLWKLKDDYKLDYNVSIKNTSNSSLTIKDFSVCVGEMETLAKLTDVKVRIPEIHIDYITSNDPEFITLKNVDDKEDFPSEVDKPIRLAALSNKFFAVLIKPKTPFERGLKSRGVFDSDDKIEAVATSGDFGEVTLSAGEVKSFDMLFYAGVKNEASFEKIDELAGGVMHLSSFGPLAYMSSKLISALDFFKRLTGSYGVSIILLTIIIRGLFWPITAKGTASMKKMQELQPLMQEIKEKYKDDQQTASIKTMELYREHKVNPVGGCLPMLVQIPIFMSFYWGLDGAVALRHVSFLWANDLSQPDVVGHFLGLPIHPLVLIMASLMVLQQKLTPSTGDQMQKNMMMFMPVMMVLLMYSMPAGLTLYWSVSNTMSIIQLLVTRKFSDKSNKAKVA